MTHSSSVYLEESFMTFWGGDIDFLEGVILSDLSAQSRREPRRET
jgi:hypothetical protein